MIRELLKDIGLSENEVTLYLTLLRYGQRPITFLSQKANLNRGLGYVLLHALLEKGLVTKVTKSRVQYFSPLDPKHLLNFLERKKSNIEDQQERVQAALGQLAEITKPLTAKPKIRFYEGADGARSILDGIRQAEGRTLRAYLSASDCANFVGAEYFRSFMKRLGDEGFTLHLIRTREMDRAQNTPVVPVAIKRGSGDGTHNHVVRYAREDLAFPMTVFIYDNKIALLSSRQENFALLIESPEYSEMQKKLFDLQWDSLERTTIRVGVLHSLTGTMAISERSLVDAILMAIAEINSTGGLLGKIIDPIVVDGASNPEIFAEQAELLITKHAVSSVFGGWTSASRKTMRPIFEKHNHLLWYAVQYEGLEQSPNIIYVGAAPNQQVLPAVDWAVKHLGKKFFLIGSDYVFPRSANEIIKGRLDELGGKIVGTAYVPLGGKNFKAVVQSLQKARPEVILNTINGESNVDFFRELRAVGITAKQIPTISFSIAEEEISRMQPTTLVGDYAAWCYFQSLDSKRNATFVQNFHTKYGRYRTTGDPVETAYSCVHLFAAAVTKAGCDEVDAIRQAARGLAFDAPEGRIRIDPDNQHSHRIANIGKLDENGQFRVVWSSKKPLAPMPYPKYKSQAEWHQFLENLRTSWGGRWENGGSGRER